jgi:F0F1-type ATP synthase epsilon subunit
MDILAALRQEEGKLQHQLKGTQTAIAALKCSHSRATIVADSGVRGKRTMSAAARARISKATKARWAKFRTEKAKRAKQRNVAKKASR